MANLVVKVGNKKDVGNKRESLKESLGGLGIAMQKVLHLSKEVEEAENNAREVQNLRADVKQKDQTIADNKVALKVLFDGFETRATEWQETKETLQKSLDDMKAEQKLTISRELEGPLKEAKMAKEEARMARGEARTAKEKAKKTNAELLNANAEVLDTNAKLLRFQIQMKETITELTELHTANAKLLEFKDQLENTTAVLTELQNCTGLVESTEELLVTSS
jgi:chromosome segregation ATPase